MYKMNIQKNTSKSQKLLSTIMHGYAWLWQREYVEKSKNIQCQKSIDLLTKKSQNHLKDKQISENTVLLLLKCSLCGTTLLVSVKFTCSANFLNAPQDSYCYCFYLRMRLPDAANQRDLSVFHLLYETINQRRMQFYGFAVNISGEHKRNHTFVYIHI